MDRRWTARASMTGLSAALLASAYSGGVSDRLGDLAAAQRAENATFPGATWAQGDAEKLGFGPHEPEIYDRPPSK